MSGERNEICHNPDDNVHATPFVISPEGQQLLETHPNLLPEVDKAIIYFRQLEAAGSSFVDNRSHGLGIDLADGMTMRYRWPGGQAILFLLEIPSQPPFVVKMRKIDTRTGLPQNISQSFIQEIKQTQSMDRDLGTDLAALGVHMRPFMFATEMVACYPFVDARIADREDPRFRYKASSLAELVDPYIQQQSTNDPVLWGNVESDLYDYRKRERGDNFLRITDNYENLMWIDPFVTKPNSHAV